MIVSPNAWRGRWTGAAFWLCLLAVYVLFPDRLSFATSIAVMALFAVSLDLILGFAGIISLGHAMFFGIGAYSAGWLALGGWTEPITGLIAAGLVAAVAAVLIGPFILRTMGLPLIMLTFVMGLILYEAANKATAITGGDNGLSSFTISPLFGVFKWSVYSKVEYLYALGCLFVVFCCARRLVASPFGLALKGIRDNPGRMAVIGASVRGHLLRIYVLSAFIAGVAGALSAQTTQFVSLDTLSSGTSINVIVMLVLGGIGTLYGAIVGTIVYMVVQHLASEWNPYNWMFVIGILLIAVVRLGRGGLLAIAALLSNRRSVVAPAPRL
jgi:branched-chain amino acid transport system permease protein